jgi:carbon monoxide dehydrogenase subunit G
MEPAQENGINLLYEKYEGKKELEKVVKKRKDTFSFLDFLVIICAFLVIAFLGYLVLNPEKEGADKRNIHRSADISSILTSVSKYVLDNKGVPESIPTTKECVSVGNEICRMGPYDCTGLVDLSFLNKESNGEESISSIPSDPSSKSVNGTGYYISYDGQGNITICAPYAERNVDISFTKFVF